MRITQEPIRLDDFFSKGADPSCGATASFVGLVRNHDHGRRVLKLHYECYRSMAEKMLEQIVAKAKERWPVDEVLVRHRIGTLEIGEAAVAIAVNSSHRAEAFQACRFVIEEIKKSVPIWKKELFEDGTGEWVFCPEHAEVSL